MAHGLVNESTPILPEDHYVCPPRPLVVGLPGKARAAFIRVEDNAQGMSIRAGSKVTLKDQRRRLYQGKFVKKPEGPERVVLKVAEYRFVDQFDESAWAIQPSKRAPCTPYPAQRTTRKATIAEDEFPLDNLTLKQL